MTKFSICAVAASAMALVLASSVNAEVMSPKAAAKPAALVVGSEKTINFFSGGSKVSKKRRADVAALADTPSGAAPASVAPKTNFVQFGLIAAAGAAAGAGTVAVTASN